MQLRYFLLQGADREGSSRKLADLGTVIGVDTMWPSRQVKVVGGELYFPLPQYARCMEWESDTWSRREVSPGSHVPGGQLPMVTSLSYVLARGTRSRQNMLNKSNSVFCRTDLH